MMSKEQTDNDCLSCAKKAEQHRLEQAKELLKAAGYVEIEGGFYMKISQDARHGAIHNRHDAEVKGNDDH